MRKKVISLLLIISVLFSMASMVGATTRASEYLERYTVALTAKGNNDMALRMTVDGVTKMTKIGVLEVFIEEKNSSTASWHEFDTYYGMDDPDTFYDYDSYDYIRTIHFDGVAGRYYRVTLTVYAGNSSGHDTGWVTSYTVQCK